MKKNFLDLINKWKKSKKTPLPCKDNSLQVSVYSFDNQL